MIAVDGDEGMNKATLVDADMSPWWPSLDFLGRCERKW